MAERAAHLVDEVLPAVPVRQWVVTFPYRLRYRLAWDHDLCKMVARPAVGAILGSLEHRAREAGVFDGRGAAVAIVQRCGSALNLNPHLHLLVLDGVFVREGEGVAFWAAPPLIALDVAEVLSAIVARVSRRQPRGLSTTWWMWPVHRRPGPNRRRGSGPTSCAAASASIPSRVHAAGDGSG